MTALAVTDAIPIADLAAASETLIGKVVHHVENATAYTNITDLNPTFAEHLLHDIYTARACQIAPVNLIRLPAGAVIHGGNEFLVTANHRLAREYIAPYLLEEPQRLDAVLATWRPMLRIREECLLLARYGLYTWGHWLAELLPKAVAVEAAYPGRFRYALPAEVLSDMTPDWAPIRLRESLAAYGLPPNRILPLQPTMDYECERLHVVSTVWSDHVMHPQVTALMRNRLVPATNITPSEDDPQRVALVRIGPGRNIANLDAVTALLKQHGFALRTVGTMPFADQVRLFRSASMVFAILGSDLTGLIYAPQGVRVISVAPAVFGDRFFYALILDRQGRYADLRGPVAALNQAEEHRSSFIIDLSQIRTALTALEPPPRAGRAAH